MARKPVFDDDDIAEINESAEQEIKAGLAAGTTLRSRMDSMSTYGVDVETQRFRWIDPALCRPSTENARHYEDLTYESCEDLISTIRTEGRQRFPAIVRETGDEEVPFEIVAGSRRHFAISWLRANNYPDFKYLIDIQKLDDEAAFRVSDIENRAREDVTDLERGQSYAAALIKHYDNNQTRMADRLGIVLKTMRRYLDLAEMDPVFIQAIGGAKVVSVSHARALKPEIGKGREHASRMMDGAAEIISERENGAQISASDAVKRIIASGKTKTPRDAAKPIEVNGEGGASLFSYVQPNRNAGLSIKMPPKFTGSRQELKEALGRLIDETYPE